MRRIHSCLVSALLCFFLSTIMVHASDRSLDKGLQTYLGQSKLIIEQLGRNLQSGRSINNEIESLRSLVENIKAAHVLNIEQFKLREETVTADGAKALARHRTMSEGYRRNVEEYLWLLENLLNENTISITTIDLLRATLDQILHVKKKPILGSLPYRNLSYPSREPGSDPPIKPAYKGGNKTVAPEDLKSTAEAPITEEIANLAQSLNWNPVSIYEWVKNNIETEWYWGSMKGAEETLTQKSGNDCDQASLLIALLRASRFPARYVRGVIEFFPDIEKAKNLTGINDPTKIAEYFQKAGIPFKPAIGGGKISNFQVEHIWVEAEIPYANYRGAPLDQYGKTWLGLDTSIKAAGYMYNTPVDLPQDISLLTVRDAYLNAAQTLTPIDYLKAYIESQLATRNPPLVTRDSQPAEYNDLIRTKNIIPEVMNILPASMQYQQVKVTREYTEVPEELKHKVRFIATRNTQPGSINPEDELFNFELGTFLLSNQKVALSYEPENIEDQEIIDSYGGLDNTPAYLVRLRPVLAINGERMVVGRDGMPMGSDYTVTIELVSPNGTERITSAHIIGNVSVIGISAQKAIDVSLGINPDEKDAEEILFEEAIRYIDRWNKAEEELASLLRFSVARPLPSVVTLGGVIDVSYLLDTPHEFNWKGVFVDANLRTVEIVQSSEFQVQSEEQKTFMQLSALQGSILENRIFEDDFRVESISTAKLFGLVRGTQPTIEILTVDKTNIDAILPTLPFDDNIKEDLKNSVNQNFTIRIPQSEMLYQDWTGIGYIKENLDTGESGYMLSGQIAGGMTAWGIDKWPAYYADTLSNTSSEPPNEDSASATSIQKITKTDLQKGKVGQPLAQPLQVIVKDKKGKPVPKVEVTFTIKRGGGQFSDSSTALKAITGANGIASANLTLGKKTSDNPTFLREEDPNKPYAQQVGENIVEASLPSGTKVTKPFTAYGLPGDATHIKQTAGDGWQGPILSFAGFVSVIVADQYENPISNVPVTFSVLPAIDRSSCDNPNQDVKQAVLVKRDDPCLKNSPTLGQCTSAAPSLVEKTDSKGALVQVILGSIPKAEYQIVAGSGSLSTTKFRLYTNAFGNCSGTDSPSIEFSVEYVYLSDSYGNNITAGKTGSAIPVQAKIYFLKEGEVEKAITINCSEGPLTCMKIVGSRKYSRVTEFLSSSVTFDGQGGVAQDGGIYTSMYTLQPGYNWINVVGRAATEYRSTEMACPGTCRPYTNLLESSKSTTIGVYGVDIQISPIPTIVGNEQGYSSKDYEITYTISPSDYKSLTAFLFIYKDGEPIATIPTEVSGSGQATIARGFQFDVNSKYEVEVVLNPGTGVEIKSGKQEIKFAEIYIEKEDPEYPDVKLRWDDYYPALGSKVITIINPKNSLNDKKVICEVLETTTDDVKLIEPSVEVPTCTPIDNNITNGKMRFKLKGTSLAPQINDDPKTGIDDIGLGFYVEGEGKEEYDIIAYYNVKNNFNTTFGEVLSGEAVFVYDDNGGDNHTGKTEGDVTIENDKKFDFVQELLNQVVPRKRSVGQNYQLLESSGDNSGIYSDLAVEAVRLFRTNFGFASPSRTFAKIKKDYSNLIINEAVWLNKIIGKDVLVGKDFSPQDKLINGEAGLYELYKNVVKPFVNNIINEANRYAGNEPTDNWIARTGEGPAGSTNPHGPGMSYCYGCKESINDFNASVANCRAEDTRCVRCREPGVTNSEACQQLRQQGGPCENIPASPKYRGNLDSSCTVGNGTADWAGLYKNELNYTTDQPFHPNYWAGIDCSGLVMKSGERARSSLGSAVNLLDLGRNSCTFFFTKAVCDAHVSVGGPPLYITDQPSEFNYNFGANDGRNSSPTSKIRRGDLVSYDGHMAIVFSEKWGKSRYSNDPMYRDIVQYDIIHAYGIRRYHGSFSRKTLITGNDVRDGSNNIIQPIGFGRITLWP